MDQLKILLLGAGYPEGQLEIRDKLGRLLQQAGHEPIIMEYTKKRNEPLQIKFDTLLNVEPDFIVALYTDEGVHDAVNFELGFVTKKYLNDGLYDKLFILSHMKLDPRKLTRYIRNGLYFTVMNNEFEDLDDAADKILTFINSHETGVFT